MRIREFALLLLCVTTYMGVVCGQDQQPLLIVYDPATGNIRASGPAELLRLQITSQQGIFVGQPTAGLADHYIHLIEIARETNSFDFGPVAQVGLTDEFLLNDLCVAGWYRINPRGITVIDLVHVNGKVFSTTPVDYCNAPRDPNGPTGQIDDPRAVLHYSRLTGNLRVDVSDRTADGKGASLTTLEIVSKGGIFTGEPAQNVNGVFDVDTNDKIFKFLPRGFEDVDFGNVVATGLTNSQFVADVCVNGSWAGGGGVQAEYQYPDAGLVPIACTPASDPPADVAVEYNPTTGDLAVNVDGILPDPLAAMKDESFTTLEIRSASGIFTGSIAFNLDGPFDIYSPTRILKQNRDGFKSVYFGPIVQPGHSLDFIRGDITIDATMLNGSELGAVQVSVPEPVSLGHELLAIVGFTFVQRGFRRSRRE